MFFVHALGHNAGKGRAFMNGPPLQRQHRMQGNTPDFMLNTLLYTSHMIQDGPLQLEGVV